MSQDLNRDRPRVNPEALIALRLRERLSISELARETGVSVAAISSLERGLSQLPRMATLRRLADFFAVPYTDLVVPRAADREEVA